MIEIMHLCGDKIDVYSGEDGLTVPMMAMGAKGTISVLSNVAPRQSVAMTDACLRGDYAAAAKMQCDLLPLINALFSEVNPIPAKAATAAHGLRRGCAAPASNFHGGAEPGGALRGNEKAGDCRMRAVICGANGAMGTLLCGILKDEVVGRVSIDGRNGAARTFDELGTLDADMVIDFSHHTAISSVLDYAKKIGAAAVIGTTGHTEEEKALIFAAAKEIPVFYSGNMSLGIAVLCRLAKDAARYFPDADIEIVEAHHNRKVDAPSGTALMLLGAIKEVRPNALGQLRPLRRGQTNQGGNRHFRPAHGKRGGNARGDSSHRHPAADPAA